MDSVLGELTESARFPGAYEGTLQVGGKSVSFRIDPDDVSLEQTLTMARRVVSNLEDYEKRARSKVCETHLELYNDDWRPERDPILTADQFSSRLDLTHIGFLACSSIDVFYGDKDMFGGHSLIAQSFDGETFEDVMMFG